MLAVTGYNSAIIRQLAMLVPNEEIVRVDFTRMTCTHEHVNADRFVFCAGVMTPRRGHDQSAVELALSMRVNYFWPMKMCDEIFKHNPRARVCVVGSESGISGSYDDAYAVAKHGIHTYVEQKHLEPDQQLVAVAPSIIGDAGMTLRRRDADNLNKRRAEHPKRRFLTAVEVARLIHYLLYVDEGYVSGVVVRMNGGMHTCTKT